jgi:hypothetical protein
LARRYVEGVLTASEASDLASEVGYLEFSDPRLAGVVAEIGACWAVSLEAPSYVRVEQRLEGHPWHTDRGAKGHMSWCSYSAGVLLTNPDTDFTGGGFYFQDDPDTPLFPYCDLITWDSASDNVHSVAKHRGNRRALIMFLGGVDV